MTEAQRQADEASGGGSGVLCVLCVLCCVCVCGCVSQPLSKKPSEQDSNAAVSTLCCVCVCVNSCLLKDGLI